MRKLKRLLTFLTAGVLAIGVSSAASSPLTVNAEGEETRLDNPAVVTSKTAELQEDGTYTITLEAYATGETVTTVVEKNIPNDVVMVMDVSGSMSDDIAVGATTNLSSLDPSLPAGTYYFYYKPALVTHKYPLRFYNGVWQYKPYYQDSYIAIEGSQFEDEILKSERTIYVEKLDALKIAAKAFLNVLKADAEENGVDHKVSLVRFANDKNTGDTSSTKTLCGLTSVTSSYSDLTGIIDGLKAKGATYADQGMQMAYDVLNTQGRSDAGKAVVFFTDGEPNHSNGFNANVANTTIQTAKKIKNDLNGRIWSLYVGSLNDNITKFLNGVSSNYPNATKYTQLGDGEDKGFVKTANESDKMEEIFQTTAQEIISGGASIQLGTESYMKDLINADYFSAIPDWNAEKNVKVFTASVTSGSADGTLTFGAREDFNATVTTLTNGIAVFGFDYSGNWCGKHAGNKYSGKKLIVEITGIIPKDSAIDKGMISTNADNSGIFAEDGTEVEEFEKPLTSVSSKAVVLDYAKTADLTDSAGQDTITKIGNISALNGNSTLLYTNAAANGGNGFAGSYGDAAVSGGKLTYTPNTMNWDGVDIIGTFGQKDDAYNYSAVAVIPATNVYYEDTFVTNTNGVKTGIVYTGNWTEEGTPANNTEDPNGTVQGWVEDLSDDMGYTDGTAHVSSTKGAKATFTFTGCGVDVYTRTNSQTGTIRARLMQEDGTTVKTLKINYIDNDSSSGDYYHIPTATFMDLDYGTYTVEIQVRPDDNGDTTYYLDGIRVYNPLDPDMSNDYIEAAYNEQGMNIGSTYLTLREWLIESVHEYPLTVRGAVFIDKLHDGTLGTEAAIVTQIGTYEELGPKNEVYLKPGQSIAIYTGKTPADLEADQTTLFIGMKAPAGETKVSYYNKDAEKTETVIEGPADMYYQIGVNSDTWLMVENTGDKLLALTKMTTGCKCRVEPEMLACEIYPEDTLDLIGEANVEEALYQAKTFSMMSLAADTEETESTPGEVVIETPAEPEVAPVVETSVIDKIFAAIRKWIKRR